MHPASMLSCRGVVVLTFLWFFSGELCVTWHFTIASGQRRKALSLATIFRNQAVEVHVCQLILHTRPATWDGAKTPVNNRRFQLPFP